MIAKGFGILDYVVFFFYFLVLILIGYSASKKGKGTADFFKAGKRIPWWAAGLSIFGTLSSAP